MLGGAMHFTDEGYIINMRRHGERGLILSLVSREHGKVTGFVRGAISKKNLSTFQLGNLIEFSAYARVDDNMLALRVELKTSFAAYFLADVDKLRVLTSFCALSDSCMPELQNLERFYYYIKSFFNFIDEESWLTHYSYFEYYLMEFLGVGLDLSECAATGATENLEYISPKTGKAVCAEAGYPYRNRLYKYPHYIVEQNYQPTAEELINLLDLTEFFLYKNFFATHNLKFPECRANLSKTLSNHSFGVGKNRN